MEWLSQNWMWIVLLVAVVWMFSRYRHGGMMGGCCGGMAHDGPKEKIAESPGLPPKEAGNQEAKNAGPSQRHRGCC